MGTLVDDLFLLAQLDRERPLALEPLDLAELVRLSVASVGVAEPDRPVTVLAGTPVWVEGDRSRLRQVVDNLLVNVQRHTPPGSAVEVSLRLEGRRPFSPSTTTGPASTRSRRPGSSSPSIAPTRRDRAVQAVPASASPSWPPSSRPIGARSASSRAPAQPLSCVCRLSRRRRPPPTGSVTTRTCAVAILTRAGRSTTSASRAPTKVGSARGGVGRSAAASTAGTSRFGVRQPR